MKLSRNNKSETSRRSRKGSASMLISAFMIIILSIIMVGFVRLMLAGSTRSSNTDVSQSAYDTALAGIEDAKVALLKYHTCLSKGHTKNDGTECGRIIAAMQDGIKAGSCDIVTDVLGRDQSSNEGTIIQETQHISDGGVAEEMVQAYTCVTINEELDDYRTTLGVDASTRVVPLRTDRLDEVAYIKLAWFSSVNAETLKIDTNERWLNLESSGYFDSTRLYSRDVIDRYPQPPLVAATVFQADSTFAIHDLVTAKNNNASDRATLFLKPSADSGNDHSAYNGSPISAEELSRSADKNYNGVTSVYCKQGSDFFCTAVMQLPKTFNEGAKRNDGASMLVLQLPYGAPETDFSVQLLNKDGKRIDFVGIQARIDSTGRANDMYRRVEARVELVDTYFPYPEFTIQMSDDADPIQKNFYTTLNCWSSIEGSDPDPCADYSSSYSYTYFY